MILRPKPIVALAMSAMFLGAAPAAWAQDAPAPAAEPPPPPPAPAQPPGGYGPPGPPPGFSGQLPASPAGQQPGPAAPAPQGAGAEIHFQPNEPGLRLMNLRGEVPFERVGWYRHGWYEQGGWAPVYSPVCNQPCVTQLPPGGYHLALAKYGGPAVPVPEPVVINGPSTIHGYYTDRGGLRAAGWVLSIAGTIAGVVMIIASENNQNVCDTFGNCYTRGTINGPLLAGGIGVIIVSGIVGTVLAFQHDEAHITIEPLRLPVVGALKESPLAAIGAEAPPQGAALSLRF